MDKTERLQVWASNVILAGFYFYFAYRNFFSLTAEFKISVLLLLLFNSSLIIFALTRRTPQAVSRSYFEQIIAYVGTLSPLLFLGVPAANDHPVFLALQIVGISFAFAGVLSLNRSFGLVPADRGIVTTGMYRFVRHPLYTGYVMLCLGFLLQNFSLRNMTAFLVFMMFESLRLLLEEQFLSKNPEYKTYMQKVRWRIIPYIW